MDSKYILGIDVAKDSLVIYDTGTKEQHQVANTDEDLKQFITAHISNKTEYTVGLESTGDYSLLPMKIFVEAGCKVRLLNPILTQSAIKRTVRGTKTDTTDSQLIAKLTSEGEGYEITKNSLDIKKKALIRTERKLSGLQSDVKRLVLSLGQKQKAGVDLSSAAEIMKQLVQDIETAHDKLWEAIFSEANTELQKQETIINSHIGCGAKLSAIISSEAGDIRRFASAKQLIAYAGIDPKVIQSGNMNARCNT